MEIPTTYQYHPILNARFSENVTRENLHKYIDNNFGIEEPVLYVAYVLKLIYLKYKYLRTIL